MVNTVRNRLSAISALLAVSLFAGCGGAEPSNLHEMKVENYVTLCDYRNLTVDVEKEPVSDEECEELLLAVYQSNVTGENGGILDRPAENGDVVNIDYAGTKDGVAFGGGSDSGVNLEIGSGSFIPGFESGLVGAVPGETRELNLSFPEGYKNNPELAGQAVVFTVKVNFIQPREMQDSVVAAFGIDGVSDLEGLRSHVRSYLERDARQQYVYLLQNAIIEKLMEESTIGELPDVFLESYRQIFRDRIAQIAASMNTTPDMYTNYYYFMGSEEFAVLYGEVQARQELLLQAIANKEGWTVGDGELEGLINDYARENGYQSAEELEAEISREQLRNYFMSERVMEHLVESVAGQTP